MISKYQELISVCLIISVSIYHIIQTTLLTTACYLKQAKQGLLVVENVGQLIRVEIGCLDLTVNPVSVECAVTVRVPH